MSRLCDSCGCLLMPCAYVAENGKSHVNRDCAEIAKDDRVGCSWEIRVNSKIGSGWDCFCDEDACNSAPVMAVSGLLLLLAVALTAA